MTRWLDDGVLNRFDLPGGHLAFRDDGQGPLVVFLHGGALDHRSWNAQLDALAADHRVVAPDARGHGLSSTPTGPFRHCDDLAALLRGLDAGPATVVGLSLGGGTAVDLALEHPDLVAGLVVSGTGTSEADFADPWVLDTLGRMAAAQQALDPAGWTEAFLRFAAGPHRDLAEVDPDVVEACRAMVARTLERHVVGAEGDPVLPVPVTGTWERVPALRVPVLAISGELDGEDHLRLGRRLAAEAPDGRWAGIDGVAHYPSMERPDAFTGLLREFLAEHAAAPAQR